MTEKEKSIAMEVWGFVPNERSSEEEERWAKNDQILKRYCCQTTLQERFSGGLTMTIAAALEMRMTPDQFDELASKTWAHIERCRKPMT